MQLTIPLLGLLSDGQNTNKEQKRMYINLFTIVYKNIRTY